MKIKSAKFDVACINTVIHVKKLAINNIKHGLFSYWIHRILIFHFLKQKDTREQKNERLHKKNYREQNDIRFINYNNRK